LFIKEFVFRRVGLHIHPPTRRHNEPRRSGKTTHADGQFPLQIRRHLCRQHLQAGGPARLLPFVHHPADYERAIPKHPLHGVRGGPEDNQQRGGVQPAGAHGERRSGGSCGRRRDHPARRLQDAAQHATARLHPRPGRGREEGVQVRRADGIFPGAASEGDVPDAGDGDLLVHVRVLQVSVGTVGGGAVGEHDDGAGRGGAAQERERGEDQPEAEGVAGDVGGGDLRLDLVQHDALGHRIHEQEERLDPRYRPYLVCVDLSMISIRKY
jgi:hypothetical protein